MKKIALQDFDKWKKLNKGNFSFFDYIFHIMKEQDNSPDIFFAFLELFWPSFIQKGEHVFLRENFSEEKYYQITKEDKNPEFWINLLTVDDFFEQALEQEQCSANLAKKLVQIWHAKLQIDFPSKKFTVKYLHDEENGDFGLTFYQTKKNK